MLTSVINSLLALRSIHDVVLEGFYRLFRKLLEK